MDVIESAYGMQKRAKEIRQEGKRIAFVPTMGFFHEGHLELMRVGKRHADKVIISLFVNPTQFGPGEDFKQYPRDLEGDLSKAEGVGVDIAFVPSAEEMYPEGFQAWISVKKVTRHLCGLSRPGHFDGVTTVVAKLFNMTKPHVSIFGEKDYQQLTVIRRMVKDLNMDMDILGIPIVREPDGLAMSSRNTYLNDEERLSALSLKKSLDLAGEMVKGGERDSLKIKRAVEHFILGHPHTEIDYITLCHPETLENVTTVEDETLLALAVKVGKTRLIDNSVIT
ncbi:MAG: pantoate--beta-alanine ligase [Pseudomonadota bacterium]